MVALSTFGRRTYAVTTQVSARSDGIVARAEDAGTAVDVLGWQVSGYMSAGGSADVYFGYEEIGTVTPTDGVPMDPDDPAAALWIAGVGTAEPAVVWERYSVSDIPFLIERSYLPHHAPHAGSTNFFEVGLDVTAGTFTGSLTIHYSAL